MDNDQSAARVARIEAAAAAEQEMISAEHDAERVLGKAESRLADAMKVLKRAQREVDERQKRVDEARAMLTAVQKRRADGPG